MDIREIVSGIGASGALTDAASNAGLDPGQAQDVLHGILEHFGGGGSATEVAAAVAAKVGVSPDQVQAFLPQVMPLLQGHVENAPEGAQGALGGLMTSLSGAFGGGEGAGLGALAKGLLGGS